MQQKPLTFPGARRSAGQFEIRPPPEIPQQRAPRAFLSSFGCPDCLRLDPRDQPCAIPKCHRQFRREHFGLVEGQFEIHPADEQLKKNENDAYVVALHMIYYNFVSIHKKLRMTPALAAKVTDRLWEISDIAALAEATYAPARNWGTYKGAVA